MAPRTDIDGGWAWCVLAASYFNLLMCSGLIITAGMFQIVLLEELQGSVALTSWVTALFSAFMQLGGPLSSLVSNRYSCRTAVMLGGALMTVGFVISGLADSLMVLFVSLGIVAGIGIGLIYTSSIVVASYFFEKRRTLANGIILSGSGLGICAMPQIARVLYEYFSWRETFIILGAASAQICVSGAIMFSVHENTHGFQADTLQTLFSGKLCWKRKNDSMEREADLNNQNCSENVSSKQVAIPNRDEYDALNKTEPIESNFQTVDSWSNILSSRNSAHIYDETEREDNSNKELNTGEFKHSLLPRSQLSSSHQQIVRIQLLDNTSFNQSCRSLQEPPSKANAGSHNHKLLVTSRKLQKSGPLGSSHAIRISLSKLSRAALGSHLLVVSRNPSLMSGIASVHQLDTILLDCLEDVDGLRTNIGQSFLEQNVLIEADKSDIEDAVDNTSTSNEKSTTFGKYPPLYKNWPFLLLNVNLFISNAGCGLFNIHIPSYYETIQMNEHEITNCLSIHGAMTLFSRILVGALANSSKDNTLVLYIMMHVIGGVIICIIPAVGTDYVSNMVLTSGVAIFAISHCVLLPTLTIQYVGLRDLATAFGVEMVFAGLGYLVAPPMAGNIVDVSGSYNYSLYLSGILFMLGGVFLLSVPLVKNRCCTCRHDVEH